MENIKFKPDKRLFENAIKRRKISQLVHFTPAINLISIFGQGAILSRNTLNKFAVEYPEIHLKDYYSSNDNVRIDGKPDYINLSIQHPNYYLLNRFRVSLDRSEDSWCIISVSTSQIFRDDTIFSVGNAASKYSKHQGIGGSFKHFEALFQDTVISGNISTQRTLCRDGLEDKYPTDVQAEVLVKERINTSEFQQIAFESNEDLKKYKGALQILQNDHESVPFVVAPDLFQLRR